MPTAKECAFTPQEGFPLPRLGMVAGASNVMR